MLCDIRMIDTSTPALRQVSLVFILRRAIALLLRGMSNGDTFWSSVEALSPIRLEFLARGSTRRRGAESAVTSKRGWNVAVSTAHARRRAASMRAL